MRPKRILNSVSAEGILQKYPLSAILLTAAATRVLLVVLNPPGFPTGWGGEVASVAVSLTSGEGFASPYWQATGPTALVPPVYPVLLSGLFHIFGTHTAAAGWAALALNVLLSTATGAAIYGLGTEMSGRKVGLMGCLLWALYPLTGFSDVLYVQNTSLYALLLTSFA